jgi:hypothetical protein
MTKRRTPPLVQAGSREGGGSADRSASIPGRRTGDDKSDEPSLIYLACSAPLLGMDRYETQLGRVRARFPTCEIIEPLRHWADVGAWLRGWRTTVRVIDLLVFFTDDLGFVGRGVWDEVHSAASHGVAVRFLTDDGRFVPEERFELFLDEYGDWREYAMVGIVGEPAVLRL